MNGVHDMGGMQCFGDVNPDPNEPLFHAEWEGKVLALTLAMGATGTWNIDQSRATRESLPPAKYLSAGYYGIWLEALEILLVANNLVSREELREGRMIDPPAALKRILKAEQVEAVIKAGTSVSRTPVSEALFQIDDTVSVKNTHPATHTRMPGYIRGKQGRVVDVHGSHVFPDTHALGKGEDPHWLYTVEFSSHELWGPDSELFTINVDCWEPYLEPVAANT